MGIFASLESNSRRTVKLCEGLLKASVMTIDNLQSIVSPFRPVPELPVAVQGDPARAAATLQPPPPAGGAGGALAAGD